jgi:hypothetical protein
MRKVCANRRELRSRIGMRLLTGVAVVVTLSAICLASFAAAPLEAQGQQEKQNKPVTRTASVDNTKMGPYRALAQMTFQAFKKGDNATAAELARILERTWDAAEDGGGEKSLSKTNKDLFDQADKAMDVFIKPIINYAAKTPDPQLVEAAYNDFLSKLSQGD